jgi:hypothetical protein
MGKLVGHKGLIIQSPKMPEGGRCGWFHHLAVITHVLSPHRVNFPKIRQ